MKTYIYKYTAVALFAAALLSGCLKLDQSPTDKFTDNAFWTSADRAQAVLNMAYSQMYHHDRTWEDEVLSDNMIPTYASDAVAPIRQGVATPSTQYFEDQWKWLFEGIKTCNVFMDKIDIVPSMDEALKSRMIAEVRFIRAWLYFRGVNLWGDMPFFLRDLTLVETQNLTRTARADVMAALHDEIDDILADLPTRQQLTAAENGRITQGAAAMLKIRFYLMDNDMEKVEEWCRRFINGDYGTYSLFTGASANYSSYESLFHSAHEYNSEVILDYAAVTEVKEWDPVGMTPQTLQGRVLTARTPSQSLVDDYITLNGLPVQGAVTYPVPYTSDPSYDEANPYVNRDPRMDATVVYDQFVWKDKDAAGNHIEQVIYIKPGTIPDGVTAFVGDPSENQYGAGSATSTGYYLRKYYDPDHKANSQSMHNNKILMRYADVLLMYAEACHANGRFSETVWNETIRPIRERAGFTSNGALEYPAGLADAAYGEIIRRERRCELAMEGLRYFDLVRWGFGPTLLNRTMYGAMMSQSNTQYVVADTWQFRSNRDELWSLPFSEMNKVPTLRPNNPGY